MNTETMNIHKALCELKLLDARLTKEIGALEAVGTTKAYSQKVGAVSVEDFARRAKETYQSIQDLMSRRNAIRRAVMLSNATTAVLIGGTEYTVAEAIEMKNHGIEFLARLCSRLSTSYNACAQRVDEENEALDRKADAYVSAITGSRDLKNISEEVKRLREHYVSDQRIELVNPLHAEKTISELSDRVDRFVSDVDSALSTSNAVTQITVTY